MLGSSKSKFVKKILSGAFWLGLGTILSKFLLALAYIILARIVTAEEYGQYGMLKSTIDNFLIFASMGIGLTTTKYISENKNENPQTASGILGASQLLVLVLGFFVAIFLLVFSNQIAVRMLNSLEMQPLLVVVSFILVITSFNGVQLGALLGLQGYKAVSISNIAQGILLFIGITLGGYIAGVKGAIIGNLLALFCLSITIHFILKKESLKFNIKATLKNWKSHTKIIYKFAIPASLSTFITAPTIWILNTMLVRTPGGYEQLGIYSAVIVFSSAIQMLNGTLGNVLLPIFLSKETEITPKKEFINYFGAWYIAILVALPLLVFPEIVSLIIGDSYNKQVVLPVVSLSLISALIISYRQGISRDLIMKNKMWLSAGNTVQWSLTTVFAFLFFKKYGAVGFALSFTIGYFSHLILFMPYIIKLKISPPSIFYNIRVIFTWQILLAIVYINLEIQGFKRIISTLIAVLLLLYCLKSIYNNYVYKK